MDLLNLIKSSIPHWLKYRIKFAKNVLSKSEQDMSMHAFAKEQHPIIPGDKISEKFIELGPWFTEFEINQKLYGGLNSYKNDSRINDFSNWARPSGKVVELGAFEGMHTLMLSDLEEVDTVLGLEVRKFLLDKCNFIKETFNKSNIEFKRADFEIDNLTKFGKFDHVFCSGVLYHMSRPWKFIEEMCSISDSVFIASHIADTNKGEGKETREGYLGDTKPEFGYSEPLSGTNSYSYWLTFDSLVLAFDKCGFKLKNSRSIPEWANGTWLNAYFKREN